MKNYDTIYVDGQWIPSDGKTTLSVFDSTNEEVMATIPEGTASDVAKAARAAKAAFISWSTTPPATRAEYLNAISDALAARMDEISSAISRETGMSKMLSNMIQVGLPIGSFKQAAVLAESFEFEKQVGTVLTGQISGSHCQFWCQRQTIQIPRFFYHGHTQDQTCSFDA